MTSGLRGTVARIHHYELNVSDLETSIAFYEALTSFRALDIVDEPHHRSVLLANTNPGAPTPTLNFVQWTDPRPVGRPHDSEAAIGFFRLVVHVDDLDAARHIASDLGAEPFAPTTGDDFAFELGSRGLVPFLVFACADPDGIVVELIQHASPKLSTVGQGTGAFDRDRGWLPGVLGLEEYDTVATVRPMPNVYLPSGPAVEFRGAFFRVPGQPGYVDWLEHRDAGRRSAPYREEQHVGIIRCAFEVDDIEAASDALLAARERGWRVDAGPVVLRRYSPPVGVRPAIDLRDPEGVRYRLLGPQ